MVEDGRIIFLKTVKLAVTESFSEGVRPNKTDVRCLELRLNDARFKQWKSTWMVGTRLVRAASLSFVRHGARAEAPELMRLTTDHGQRGFRYRPDKNARSDRLKHIKTVRLHGLYASR